jgi:hypothetical protein
VPYYILSILNKTYSVANDNSKIAALINLGFPKGIAIKTI